MIVAGVGAMLSFAGCGAKGPDAVALDVFKTIQAGKATPEYLAQNCTAETARFFSMFGSMAAEGLKGATFTVVSTKIDGSAAVVTIKQDGGNDAGVKEYDLVLVDGKWKLDINEEKKASRKIEEKLIKGDKNSSAAEKVLMACIELAKKGSLNKESAKKYFCCQDDELEQLLGMFEIFNYKSSPDYKNASKQDQETADKELGNMGVASSSFSATGGYAVVIIGDKTNPGKELCKFKVVKNDGVWKIAGVYVEEVETLKRAESL